MNNYITLPSKLNDMSLSELEMHSPNAIGVLLKYLQPKHSRLIDSIAIKIAKEYSSDCLETSKVAGVNFIKSKGWYAYRRVKGKPYHIKAGRNKQEVEAAAIKFAKKNNLKVYR